MFGVPIVVILYCFFIAVSPFCPKDSDQTRNFLATLSKFFSFFWKISVELAKNLRLWLVVLWTRKKQDVFFFPAESLSDFGLNTFICANTNRATARVKNIVRSIKIQKFSLYFYCFLAVFAKIGLFGFRRKTKKIKGVNNQNEKSNYLCPLFQR